MKLLRSMVASSVVFSGYLYAADDYKVASLDAWTTGGFVDGTMVLTEDKYNPMVPIENIMVSHTVTSLTKDESQSEKSVHDIYVHTEENIVTLAFSNDGKITLAGDQVIFVPTENAFLNGEEEGNWVQAKELEIGSPVYSKLHGVLFVTEKTQENGFFKVHNIELEDTHTFFVGEQTQVLVHNAKFGTPKIHKPKWVHNIQREAQKGANQLAKGISGNLPAALLKQLKNAIRPMAKKQARASYLNCQDKEKGRTEEEVENEFINYAITSGIIGAINGMVFGGPVRALQQGIMNATLSVGALVAKRAGEHNECMERERRNKK